MRAGFSPRVGINVTGRDAVKLAEEIGPREAVHVAADGKTEVVEDRSA